MAKKLANIPSLNLGGFGDSYEGCDIEGLIREADSDGVGWISYKNFLEYLQHWDPQEQTPKSSRPQSRHEAHTEIMANVVCYATSCK